MAPVSSGLFIPGDVKSMVPMTIANKIHYVIGKNQDYLQVVKPKD
jgi:hypothetical protein